MLVRNKPFARVMGGGCLLLCLLVLASGCSKKRRAAEHVDVTGEVTFDGKPLTGGKITFVTMDGFAGSGTIDENGHYQVSAPVGEVQIGVDNTALQPKKDLIAKAASKGAGRPTGPPPEQMKGTYVRIPREYYNPATSGLTYTVTKDKGQVHKIELKSK